MNAPEAFRAGSIWSLLDLLKLHAPSILKLGFASGGTELALPPLGDAAMTGPLPKASGDIALAFLAAMRDTIANPIGAKVAAVEINRLIDLIESGRCTGEIFRAKSYSIYSRIEDELSGSFFYYLDPRLSAYFDAGPSFFGNDIGLKFPSLHHDISEAGKCLALGRSTASAFHALRSLEAAIRAMSRCLGIADPTRGAERSWGKMLGHIKAEMDRRWKPGSASVMSGDGQLFEDAYAALAGLQNPWRNATMHLEQNYTQEEAEELLTVVKGFMQRIAKRMDEDGNPKA